ncbi:hypothetical protein NA57DRAFT_74361 [Rhizodiscina lignyota]|uniref:Uncharacterized protein n=1 Tax=Rhizodiscina lignyota TaxID=1504668 RepID=A0A9P4IK67_9PEZI|nr:hypothetical protein NA57DRAFT_74361 [Rhizodiscina lignyota]
MTRFGRSGTYFEQRMPTKAETRALEESINSRYSPPSSPLIERRPLTPTTEAELKAACAAVARDYKPSDTELEHDNRVAEVNAQQIARAKREEAARRESQSRYVNSRFDGFPSTAPHVSRPTKHSYQPDAPIQEVIAEPQGAEPRHAANVGKQRESRQLRSSQSAYPPRRSSLLPPPVATEADLAKISERPVTAPQDHPSDSSSSTPRTGSTDHRFGQPSTDMTSAAWTAPSSKHTSSNQLPADQAAAMRADAQASDWMKQEMERRRSRREQAQQNPPSEKQPSPSRGSSRGRSIRSDLREYMRPRSTSRGRPPSSGQDSNSSNHGWRSWGFQRRMSYSHLVLGRPGSTTSLAEVVKGGDKNPGVDLNRELPPLPGLDQWKGPEDETEEKPANGVHIAALMRTESKGRANKKSASFSESMPNLLPNGASRADSVAVAQAVPLRVFPTSREMQPRSYSSLAQRNDGLHHAVTSPVGAPSVTGAKHVRHKTSSSTASAPNFSRKLSTDQGGRPRGSITALPSMTSTTPSTDKKGLNLKKMFSGFGKTKEPKSAGRPGSRGARRAEGDWMAEVESNGGVRNGMLVIDEAAGAPVVRY